MQTSVIATSHASSFVTARQTVVTGGDESGWRLARDTFERQSS